MKSHRFIIIAVCICMVFSFGYGVLSVHYKLFPFEQMKMAWRLIEPDNERLNKLVHMSNTKSAIYYNYKVSIFEKLGRHDYNVVFVGDSLTDYAEWQDSYPSLKIANRGISGDTTEGVSRRLESIYSTSASTVFVMMGINDLLEGIAADKVFDNYIDIVNKLTKHRLTVYIQSTLLSGSEKNNSQNLNDKIHALNMRLQKFAKETESVFFIDLNAVLAPESLLIEEYTLDGIHLNGNGYLKWNKLIQPYLIQYTSVNNRT